MGLIQANSSVYVPTGSSDYFGIWPIWTAYQPMPTPVEDAWAHIDKDQLSGWPVTPPDWWAGYWYEQEQTDPAYPIHLSRTTRLELYHTPPALLVEGRGGLQINLLGMGLTISKTPGLQLSLYTDYPSAYARRLSPTRTRNMDTAGGSRVDGLYFAFNNPLPTRDELSKMVLILMVANGAGGGGHQPPSWS